MAMSTEKSVVLKFISDMEDIQAGFKKFIAEQETFVLKLRVQPVGMDGQPFSMSNSSSSGYGGYSAGWGGSSGSAPTPGQNSGDLTRARLYQQYNTTGQQEMTQFQSLRQNDSNFHYLEAQRAINSRTNSMNALTGGKGGSEFLSDKVAELSKTNDPKLQGTIAALNGLKEKFDTLTASLNSLNETEKKGGMTPDGVAANKRAQEDALRAQQQIVQTASGFGAAGTPKNPFAELLEGIKRAAVISTGKEVFAAALMTPMEREHTRSVIGSEINANLEAVMRQSQGDIVTRLNPNVASASAGASWLAAMRGHSDNAFDSLQAGNAAATSLGMTTSLPVEKELSAILAGVGTSGAMMAGLEARDAAQSRTGRRWAEYNKQYQAYSAMTQAGKITALDEAERRSGLRASTMASFGIHPNDMLDMGEMARDYVTETGFDETNLMQTAGGLGYMRGGAFMGARKVGQTARGMGMNTADLTSMAQGLTSLGSADTASVDKLVEIIARGNKQGFDTSELNKRSTEAIISISQGFGGAAGATGVDTAALLMQNAGSLFPDSKVASTSMARAFGSMMNSDTTSRGGMQQYLNAVNSSSVLGQLGIDDPGMQLQALLGNMNPAEITDLDESTLVNLGVPAEKIPELKRRMLQSYGASRGAMYKAMGGGSTLVGMQAVLGGSAKQNEGMAKMFDKLAAGEQLSDADLAALEGRSADAMENGATTLGVSRERAKLTVADRGMPGMNSNAKDMLARGDQMVEQILATMTGPNGLEGASDRAAKSITVMAEKFEVFAQMLEEYRQAASAMADPMGILMPSGKGAGDRSPWRLNADPKAKNYVELEE